MIICPCPYLKLTKLVSRGPFYFHPGLTLIPAWINNYIHYKVRDEITYPFLNFNGCTVELYWKCDFLSILGLKTIHVSKGAPGEWTNKCRFDRELCTQFVVCDVHVWATLSRGINRSAWINTRNDLIPSWAGLVPERDHLFFFFSVSFFFEPISHCSPVVVCQDCHTDIFHHSI